MLRPTQVSRLFQVSLWLGLDNINISRYVNGTMVRENDGDRTRQIYASVREDVYLAAKARAAELRVPLREFIERALELALAGKADSLQKADPSTWDDDYLRIQAQQPLGSPVELTKEEAKRVAKASFGLEAAPGAPPAAAAWPDTTITGGTPDG